MKIKFDVEIDTNEDRDVHYEIIELLKLVAERIDLLNSADSDE